MTDTFEEFVVTRSPRLLSTAYQLTHDWAAAEDLLQVSLAKAWRAWRRIHGDPEPYVRRIMINSFASWWRAPWWHERPTESIPEQPAPDRPSAITERDQVWRALGRLPRRQRAVLVLRYYEDLPEAEVAEILGVTTGTVKSQASRALAKLRLDGSLTPLGIAS
jgi:RNA polymerase sigma-70 factor (sigma-E family)